MLDSFRPRVPRVHARGAKHSSYPRKVKGSVSEAWQNLESWEKERKESLQKRYEWRWWAGRWQLKAGEWVQLSSDWPHHASLLLAYRQDKWGDFRCRFETGGILFLAIVLGYKNLQALSPERKYWSNQWVQKLIWGFRISLQQYSIDSWADGEACHGRLKSRQQALAPYEWVLGSIWVFREKPGLVPKVWRTDSAKGADQVQEDANFV